MVNDRDLHELSVQPVKTATGGLSPDHVHLLLQIPPRISVSKVVNLLKGGSSIVIRRVGHFRGESS